MDFRKRRGLTFVDRGDTDGWDFDKNDFTCNTAWHALDLSAIVPANAEIVKIIIEAQRADAGRLISFRTNGNVNAFNISWLYLSVASQYFAQTVSIYMGSSNIIDYKASSGTYVTFNMVVSGWWVK